MKTLCLAIALLSLSAPAWAQAGTAQLAWTDNSANETGFTVERSTNGLAGYAEIARTAQNVAAFTDAALPTIGLPCYRVRAFLTQAAGQTPPILYSAYSNEACLPATLNAPGGLRVTGTLSFSGTIGGATSQAEAPPVVEGQP